MEELEGVYGDYDTEIRIRLPVTGDGRHLTTALSDNATLESLAIARAGFNDRGLEELSSILLNHLNSISELDLSFDCLIGEDGISALVELFKNTSKITDLTLCFVDGQKGVQHVLRALSFNTSITKFTLRDTTSEKEAAAVAMGLALRANVTLTTLILERNKWGDDGAQAIASALVVSDSLTHIRMEGEEITDIGFRAIALSLKNNDALTTLELDENTIEELTGVDECLNNNSTLSTLSLNHNNVDDVGAQTLFAGLCMNKGLTCLHLKFNDIHWQGFQELAEALEEDNTTLLELTLRGNNGGNVGASAFATSLRTNTSLKTLDLSTAGGCFGAIGSNALFSAMKVNSTLETLKLESCNVDQETMELIDECTLHNRMTRLQKVTALPVEPVNAPIVGRSLLEDMQNEAEKSSTKDLAAKYKRKEAELMARVAELVKHRESQEKEIADLREQLRGKSEHVADLKRDIKVKGAQIHLLQAVLPANKRRRTRSRP